MFRVREWSFSVPSGEDESDPDPQTSRQTPSREGRVGNHSVWNCDGEIIHSPSLNIRYEALAGKGGGESSTSPPSTSSTKWGGGGIGIRGFGFGGGFCCLTTCKSVCVAVSHYTRYLFCFNSPEPWLPGIGNLVILTYSTVHMV